jgi:hypothetical protein
LILPIAHGIRNEVVEELEKREEMCLLKGKEKRKYSLKRRYREQYSTISREYPDIPTIQSLNAVVVRRDRGDLAVPDPPGSPLQDHR